MMNSKSIEKVCGFYVSNMHLATKILPFIGKQIENNYNIVTLLEYRLKENIKLILDKIIINEKSKNNILNIDWDSTNRCKMTNINQKLKTIINNRNNIILVSGSQEYIEKTNKIFKNYSNKYEKKIKKNKIIIINCYEITEFNNDIRDILDGHDLILNTSGIKRIEEVFDGYEKKTANY